MTLRLRRDVCPSADGRFLLSASDDHTSRLWDINTAEVKLTLVRQEHVVTCCTLAPSTAYGHLESWPKLRD